MKLSKTLSRSATVLAFAILPLPGMAQESKATPSIGKPASTVYRHVMPDGRIVYSDTMLKSGKVDETIVIDPAIDGNPWAGGSSKRPQIAPQVKNTPVNRVPSIPALDQPRVGADVESDVVKAEMLLEDAKKKKDAGVEPFPGERTGTVSGFSRLNEAYWARQEELADQVKEAEAMLENARAERRSLQAVR